MNTFTSSPFFGLALSMASFLLFSAVQKKTQLTFLNPLLLSIASIVAVLVVFDIPVDDFMVGGNLIAIFLMPATACLALKIYSQRAIVRKNLIPIVAGCMAGSITSVVSILVLGKLLGLEEILLLSSLSKSSTTPIAVEVTQLLGGETSVTVMMVIATGVLGSLVMPGLLKLFKKRSSIATGIAMGTASHAVGTAAALKMGEEEGTASSIAITIAGIFQFLFIVLLRFLHVL